MDDMQAQKIGMHDEDKPNEKSADQDADFAAEWSSEFGTVPDSEKEDPRSGEGTQHDQVVDDGQRVDCGSCPYCREYSNHGKSDMDGDHPAEELPHGLANHLIEKQSSGHQNRASDNPSDPQPEHLGQAGGS